MVLHCLNCLITNNKLENFLVKVYYLSFDSIKFRFSEVSIFFANAFGSRYLIIKWKVSKTIHSQKDRVKIH